MNLSMNLTWERRRLAGELDLLGFMVPMHGRKAEGAFHEPYRFSERGIYSAGGVQAD